MHNAYRLLIFIFCCSTACAQNLTLTGSIQLHTDTGAVLYLEGDFKADNTSSFNHYGILKIGGNWENNVGATLFSMDTGDVEFVGSSAQTISGNNRFFNLRINNSSGVSITAGHSYLVKQMWLEAGEFDTGDSLTLLSSASRTARINAITGDSVEGDVTIQRYIPTAIDNWRMLAIPVKSATLQQWSDDFVMTGFTGSHYPNFNFTSVYFYEESDTGAADSGYYPATNITNTVALGQGLWAYLGPLAFTIDATGEIYSGTLSLPVTYTDDPNHPASADGWCQIANPYPSTIDWDAAGWTKTNVNDAIYIWDGNTSQYKSYVGGVGTNGGTNLIPSSQSFFVQTNAASPALQITENAKSGTDPDFVNRLPKPDFGEIRLELEGWNFKDECVIAIRDEATEAFDPSFDALKIYSRNPYAPGISTEFDNAHYSINSLNARAFSEPIPVITKIGWPGPHVIKLTEKRGIPSNYCAVLFDTESGIFHPLDSNLSVSFFGDTGSTTPRFFIHLYPIAQASVADVSCHGDHTGVIHLKSNGVGPWAVNWQGESGLKGGVLCDGDSLLIEGLPADRYTVMVNDQTACGSVPLEVSIKENPKIQHTAVVEADTGSHSGAIRINATGGAGAKSIFWGEPLFRYGFAQYGLKAGFYTAEITDSLNCSKTLSVNIPFFESPNGIQYSSREGIGFFPNPCSGELNYTDPQSKTQTIIIRDAKGRICNKLKASGGQLNLTLSTGLYTIQFLDDQENLLLSDQLIIKAQ